jgi:hypothetical protein
MSQQDTDMPGFDALNLRLPNRPDTVPAATPTTTAATTLARTKPTSYAEIYTHPPQGQKDSTKDPR